MSESLEKNPFYRILVTQHHNLFTTASNECSMICIPRSSSLKGVPINQQFISSHLLKQSPLLKGHLVPINAFQVTDVEVRDRKLIVTNKSCQRRHEIEIIASEDAFNEKNQMYQMNVIDRPMTYPHIENVLAGPDSNHASITSLFECKDYLMQVSIQKFEQLSRATQKFAATFEVDPENVENIAEDLQCFIGKQIERFEFADITVDEDVINYSIESVVLDPISERLMSAIITVYDEKVFRMKRQMKLIQSKKLSLMSLGSQLDLKIVTDHSETKALLLQLESLSTSIEKAAIFKEFVSFVRKLLEKRIQDSRSPFNVTPLLPVLSEDLVAASVLILSDIEYPEVFYHFKFVQMFGLQLPATDEMAFSVVTIEAALEVIHSFDPSFIHRVKQTPSKSTTCDTNKTPSNETPKKVDTKYNRKLMKLNKLLSDVTSEDSKTVEAASTATSRSEDDDLGEFLSSLHVSKFSINHGKLN